MFDGGLIVDNFAGGGGASTGIEWALGRSPDIAINHDPEAVAMHAANHPKTLHYAQNIWSVNPLAVTRGKRVALAWFSPDCKHFSKAKGGRPVEKKIRDLAWVVVEWAALVRPAVIILENVEEFATWGPLLANGLPCPRRRGETFEEWCTALRRQSYRLELRELRGADYGEATMRKRLFIIARCDGLPIVWPEPTHAKDGAGGLLPWRSAAEIIDWSRPCPSIFLTREQGRAQGCNRPLADATMARIARGVQRFVIDAQRPFLVSVAHGDSGGRREYDPAQPLGTITQVNSHAVVAPYLVPRYGERDGQEPRCLSIEDPAPTIVPTGNGASLVAAFLAQHNTGMVGHRPEAPLSTLVGKGCTQAIVAAHLAQHNSADQPRAGRGVDSPLSTITATGHQQSLVTSHLVKLRGTCRDGQSVAEPVPTLTAGGTHVGEVRAFLSKYYGTGAIGQALGDPLHTVTERGRFALVTVDGAPYEIVDIGMRMLTPREMFSAQGFPPGYRIDVVVDGAPITKTAQTRMCGNSVNPRVARALVRAQFGLPAIVDEREAA